jgi:hypothetical protein
MTVQPLDFNASEEFRDRLGRLRMRSGAIGILGMMALAIGVFNSPDQFFRSYLWTYIFLVGISVGCLAWLMCQYLTGGAWGVVIRRPAEAAACTLPLLAAFFIPIAFGIPSLYKWSHLNVVAGDEILRHKQGFLNVPFFLVRAAIYLGGWSVLGWLMDRRSAIGDRQGLAAAHRMLSRISAPGLIFWGFAVTFMAIDWVMSLDPHWFSTMYGLLFVANQGLSSLAFLITVLVLLSGSPPMSLILTHRHLHDLGKLLLANVMIWAYFSFSQFLIVWAGNLPAEIPWYQERLRDGWQYVALILVLGHFALPFGLLLSRSLKRNFKLLAGVAVFIQCMRLVDTYWLVAPDAANGRLAVSWVDFAALLGLGGLWLTYFLGQLGKRPLMPLNDVGLVEALEHGRG